MTCRTQMSLVKTQISYECKCRKLVNEISTNWPLPYSHCLLWSSEIMLTICSWSSNMTRLAEFWSYNWPLALCLNAITHDMLGSGQACFNPISFTCTAEICDDLDIMSMCSCGNTFVIRYVLVAPPMSLWSHCQIHYNSLVYSFSTPVIRFINTCIFMFTYDEWLNSTHLKWNSFCKTTLTSGTTC